MVWAWKHVTTAGGGAPSRTLAALAVGMRQKRAKAYRRLVHQYVLYYHFREPFQVLIDDTFAESLVRLNVQEPLKQLGMVLQAKVKPMITQCCMAALYEAEMHSQGDEKQMYKRVIALAKEWERRKCNHKETQPPIECLSSVIGPVNQHRYVLAADSASVRRAHRRQVPGLPMLHYSQSVLILEPMSDVTERHIAHLEQSRSALDPEEQRLLPTMPAPAPAPAPKRKRAKGPNPLSVKKKKAAPAAAPPTPAASAKRRRHKKRGRGSTVQ